MNLFLDNTCNFL